MKKIQDHFDKIYVINLVQNTERLDITKKILEKHGITDIEVFQAIKYEASGAIGIYHSFYLLIQQAYFSGFQHIAVFEDDIDIVNDQLQAWLQINFQFVKMLSYDILYLGCNSHEPHEGREPFKKINSRGYCDTLLQVQDVWACHAMVISRNGMYRILQEMNKGMTNHLFSFANVLQYDNPLDVLIQQKIQPGGNCYATYPMMVTQRSGYSDIEKKIMNQDYLLTRFQQNTINLMK